MAREWALDTADRLEDSASPLSTGPCTLAAWIHPDGGAAMHWVAVHTPGDTFSTGFKLSSNAGFVIAFQNENDPSTGSVALQSGLADGEWSHAAGQFISTTSRYAWMNGTKGTEDTVSVSWPTTMDQTILGCHEVDAGFAAPADGRLAEVGIWDVDLTDAEIVSLSQGASPLMVRPASLVAYWPLHAGSGAGNEKDWVGSFDLTETGTVTAVAHPPRIVYPHVEAAPIRFPRFFDRDWVGEHPMRHFGEVTNDAHPAQMKYPHPPQAIYLLSEPVVGVPNSLALLGVGR